MFTLWKSYQVTAPGNSGVDGNLALFTHQNLLSAGDTPQSDLFYTFYTFYICQCHSLKPNFVLLQHICFYKFEHRVMCHRSDA